MPEQVIIHLLENGVRVQSLILNKENNWEGTFKNLKSYAYDQSIVYTIEEETIEGFTSTSKIKRDYYINIKQGDLGNADYSRGYLKEYVGDTMKVNLYVQNSEGEYSVVSTEEIKIMEDGKFIPFNSSISLKEWLKSDNVKIIKTGSIRKSFNDIAPEGMPLDLSLIHI